MANWIAAKQTPSGDVIGIHMDEGHVFVGSVPSHFQDEPGGYIALAFEDLETLAEVVAQAVYEIQKRSKVEAE